MILITEILHTKKKKFITDFLLNISKEKSTLNEYLLAQIWKPSYNQFFFLSKCTLIYKKECNQDIQMFSTEYR